MSVIHLPRKGTLRRQWVLSEIEKIKEEQKAAAGEGSSGKTGNNKKRRPADDTDGLQDVVEPRLGKRRRMGKTDDDHVWARSGEETVAGAARVQRST
jgi:hypothetical protein